MEGETRAGREGGRESAGEEGGMADGGGRSPRRRRKDGGCDRGLGRRTARPQTYPPGHGLMPAAAPGSLQGLAGGEGAARGSGPRWPAVPTPGGGAGGWVPGPPTPTAVSGRRRAAPRLRAWTPSLPPPRGSPREAPASEGRGEEAGAGRSRPPPPGPPVPPPGPGRMEPAQEPQTERRGRARRGRARPGAAASRRWRAGGMPAAPSLRLSPSPGLSLSLWSHPEVPPRRCLTHCPPVARPRGRAGRERPEPPPPLPPSPPPGGAAAAFGGGSPRFPSPRLVGPGPHPAGLPLAARRSPPRPAPPRAAPRRVFSTSPSRPPGSLSLSAPFLPPSLSLHLPASLFSLDLQVFRSLSSVSFPCSLATLPHTSCLSPDRPLGSPGPCDPSLSPRPFPGLCLSVSVSLSVSFLRPIRGRLEVTKPHAVVSLLAPTPPPQLSSPGRQGRPCACLKPSVCVSLAVSVCLVVGSCLGWVCAFCL